MGKINMATATINSLLTLVQTAFNANRLQVQYGGTGVTNYNALRSQLGLGDDTTQPLPVERGGTGATSLAGLKGAILSGGSGVIPIEQGGTGRANLLPNAVLFGNGTEAIGMASPGDGTGVLQVTAANAQPAFGVVPIALGGTGVSAKSDLSYSLGLGNGREQGNITVFDPIPVPRGGTGQDNLNGVSKELGLGDTINSPVPLTRGGTGISAASIDELRSGIKAIANNGDSNITGDYTINGNITIQNSNSNPNVSPYNLTSRFKELDQTIAGMQSNIQTLQQQISDLQLNVQNLQSQIGNH